jgi:hypothetical protein
MHPRDFINNLTKIKSEYNHPSQAEDQANSLDTISDDIYSESERFIYELVQNADDACKDVSLGVKIHIEFTEKFIIVSHTGREFAGKDIESLASVGKSQKTGNANQTGYKGIGFKSVFGKSNCVYINSGGYCFRFSKEDWSNESHKMPWQIIPIWTDSQNLPVELRSSKSFINNYPVSTAIEYFGTKKLREDLLRLFQNTQIMLFLRNVISITVDSKETFIAEKIKNIESGTVYLKKNGQVQSEWLLKEFHFSIDEDIQKQLKCDDKSPKKLQQSTNTTISFAARLDDGRLVPVKEESLVFTYLPTKINLGLPFLVNADFLTNAPREGFHEDRIWNIWLFNQVGIKIFEWLGELAQHTVYKFQITSLIPSKFSGNNNLIKLGFNLGFDEGIETNAFIPDKDNGLMKASEALIDNTDIQEIIGSNLLIKYYNSQNSSCVSNVVNNELQSKHRLSNINVRSFKVKDLKDLCKSNLFKSSFDLKNNYDLIKFFYGKCTNKNNGKDWLEIINDIDFIFDQNKILSSPNSPLYFPTGKIRVSVEALKDSFKFVHANIFSQIKSDEAIYKWLYDDLGITEPTARSIVEKIIIPNIDELSNTEKKSKEIVNYLFTIHKKGLLTNDHFNQLSSVYLITKKTNTLRKASTCYLSDKYKPEMLLDNYLDDEFLVSTDYLSENTSVLEWNIFFTAIKVDQTIKFVEYPELSYSKLIGVFPDYVNYIHSNSVSNTIYGSYTHQHKIKSFVSIKLLDKTNNPKFAKIFWEHLLKDWNRFLEMFNTQTVYYSTFSSAATFNVPNYINYFIHHKECIPTLNSKCYISDEVIINRDDFKEVAGDCLPILDLDIKLSNELEEVFKFRSQIRLHEYLYILETISKTSHNQEDMNKLIKRISLIYEALSKFTLDYEKDEIKAWAVQNKILAMDNHFYLPEELYYIAIKNFETPANINTFIQLPNRNSKLIHDLLQTFGVNIIGNDSLTFEASDDVIEEEYLKNKLLFNLPLIVLASEVKNRDAWYREFDKLSHHLKQSQFYKASELFLGFEQAGQNIINKQKRKAWSVDNKFYYTGEWNSPRILYSITGELCKFLQIKDSERELNVLLLETFKSGIEWLEEQGYDTEIIPEKYKTDVEVTTSAEEQSDDVKNIAPLQTDLESTSDDRTDEQKSRDIETGRIGEEFVYKELKRILLEKYQTKPESLIEIENGFKLNLAPKKIKVIWENKTSESFKDHDFMITETHKIIENNKLMIKDRTIYIDSKATTTELIDTTTFHLSVNEWNLMRQDKTEYYIARVFNTRNSPYVEFVKLLRTQGENL